MGDARLRVLESRPEGQGYYGWMVHQVRLRGRSLSLFARPQGQGVEGLDPATVLLAENLDLTGASQVLDLECGAGLVGVYAGSLLPEGNIWMAAPDAVSLDAARRTLAANPVNNATVWESSGVEGLPPEAQHADVVALRLPKGQLLQRRVLLEAYQALRNGGRIYVGGGKREGVKPFLKLVERSFGNLAVLAYRKGFRVARAVKGSAEEDLPPELEDPRLVPGFVHRFPVQVRGHELLVCSRPGVFSWERLDPGSRCLLEALVIEPEARVLDLGCGAGVVGGLCARLAPQGQVVLVDSDVNAVQSARWTIAHNGLDNCQVLLSDCASQVEDLTFDVVVTNPPFHQGQGTGYVVAHQFIREARQVLRTGGRFYLVANHFLPYEAQIEAAFGHVKPIYRDTKFKVIGAERV